MDPAGIVVWIIVAAVIAAAATVGSRFLAPGHEERALLYTIPGALLGTFMGSESFTYLSTWGPDITGYFILPSIIFGIVIAGLAALAAIAEPGGAGSEGERA